MARARNIKPGFFINENLVELPFPTRLLFIGLWTIADREGRLDDRPRKIKMAIFPADDVDVERGLSELHGAGMILRYIVDGKRFISIPSFLKHQNPHINEQDSVIPAPDAHGASMVHATPLTSSLNPSSLNPDSLFSENGKPPLKEIFLGTVESGLVERMGIKTLPNRREWHLSLLWAFQNDFAPDAVLETYDLMKQGFWKDKSISAKALVERIPNLEGLRAEVKKNGRQDQKLPTAAEKLAEDEEARRNRVKSV